LNANVDNSTLEVNPSTNQLRVKSGGPYVPAGTVFPFAGSTIPTGYAACDGSAKNAVADPTYLPLWNAISTTWGGTGQSNFFLPDFRGRSLIGDGTGPANYQGDTNPALTARTLGQAKGRETMAAADMPNHTHTTVNAGSHAHSGATYYIGSGTSSAGTWQHRHGGSTGSSAVPAYVTSNEGGDGWNSVVVDPDVDAYGNLPGTGHSHSISYENLEHRHGIGSDGDHGHTINYYGGSTAGNNMTPVAVIKWMIKL
jgi:microcystin-dependent protein